MIPPTDLKDIPKHHHKDLRLKVHLWVVIGDPGALLEAPGGCLRARLRNQREAACGGALGGLRPPAPPQSGRTV